jgi:hypothetical protein
VNGDGYLDLLAVKSGFSPSGSYNTWPGNSVTKLLNLAGQPGVTSLTTPTVALTPASPTIAILQSLAINIAVSGGTGLATPIGIVALSSGSYTSTPATLKNGIASINIPAGSLALGIKTLSA